MAEITQFDIGQRETFRILLTITNNDTGAPLNLSSQSFSGQVRENYSTDDITTSFGLEKALPHTSGSVYVTLTSAQTAAFTQRKYVYDINMTDDTTGYVRRILEGYFVVRPTATR